MSPEERASLIALVDRIMRATDDEGTHDALIADLRRRVVDPGVLDLIYWPHHRGYEHELSSADVVDAALAYEPIAL